LFYFGNRPVETVRDAKKKKREREQFNGPPIRVLDHFQISKLSQDEAHPPNFQAAEPGSHAPPRRGEPPGPELLPLPRLARTTLPRSLAPATATLRARVSASSLFGEGRDGNSRSRRVDVPVAPTRTTCSTKSLVRVALELMATVVPVADGRPGRKGTGAEGPRRGGVGGRRPRAHVSFNSLAVKMVCRPFCDWPRVCSCRCVRFLPPCLLVPSACMCSTACSLLPIQMA
jgi:hypothetical protein